MLNMSIFTSIELYVSTGWLIASLILFAVRLRMSKFETRIPLQFYLVLSSLLGASITVSSALHYWSVQSYPPWLLPWICLWGLVSVFVSMISARRYCFLPYSYVFGLALAYYVACSPFYHLPCSYLELTFGISVCLFSLWAFHWTRRPQSTGGRLLRLFNPTKKSLASIGLAMGALIALLGAAFGLIAH